MLDDSLKGRKSGRPHRHDAASFFCRTAATKLGDGGSRRLCRRGFVSAGRESRLSSFRADVRRGGGRKPGGCEGARSAERLASSKALSGRQGPFKALGRLRRRPRLFGAHGLGPQKRGSLHRRKTNASAGRGRALLSDGRLETQPLQKIVPSQSTADSGLLNSTAPLSANLSPSRERKRETRSESR